MMLILYAGSTKKNKQKNLYYQFEFDAHLQKI